MSRQDNIWLPDISGGKRDNKNRRISKIKQRVMCILEAYNKGGCPSNKKQDQKIQAQQHEKMRKKQDHT